ncbi:MAG: type II CAAX endopeptidase family protein, partial [FCB group bacterium]|nr:type II CAAX endopeptidase family protein [FCB group bacterium]
MTLPGDSVDLPTQEEATGCPCWGPWQSLAFAVGIFAACELLVSIVLGGLLLSLPQVFPSLVHRPSPLDPWVEEAGLLSLLTPTKLLLGLVLFVIVARLRGTTFARYYAVRLPSGGTAKAEWLLAALVLSVCMDLLRVSTGRPLLPDWVTGLYTHAPSLPLLFVAVVVAAPLYEELLFRGLLLPGLANSPLGSRWSVVVTSAIFALVHFQYDPYDMLNVFALGVFLGAARVLT